MLLSDLAIAVLTPQGLRAERGLANATEFYRQHRQKMDEGAVVAWPGRYSRDELSAIQHAMNLKLQDERPSRRSTMEEGRGLGQGGLFAEQGFDEGRGLAVTAPMFAATKLSGDQARELAHAAERTGVPVDQLSALAYAARKGGAAYIQAKAVAASQQRWGKVASSFTNGPGDSSYEVILDQCDMFGTLGSGQVTVHTPL